MSRCCTFLLLATISGGLAGCPGPGSTPADGGGHDAAGGSSTLTLLMRLERDGEPFDGPPPAEVGDGWSVSAAVLQVAEVGPRSDRGPAEQLPATGPLRVDLFGAGRDVVYQPAPPATYAELSLVLQGDGPAPALTMTATREGIDHVLILGGRTEQMPRCEDLALSLGPGDSGRMELLFESGELLDELAGETLPDPVEGVVHVDAASAPALAARLEERLGEVFEARCGDEDMHL